MSTRLPFTTPDYLHDKRFAHDPKLDDTFRAEGIAALVGVPLIWDGEVIGLLFVADRYHRTHTAQSISILSTLATHGAVALKNANDFDACQRRARKGRAGARRARAARAQHPGRCRGARADDLAAGEGRLACRRCASRSRSFSRGSVLVLDEAGHVVSRGVAAGYDRRQRRPARPTAAQQRRHGARCSSSRQMGRSVLA